VSRRVITLPLLAVALALLLSGCGEKEKVVNPGEFGNGDDPSNFQGFFASEDGAGRIGVIISASAATGALSPEGGGSVALAGTYDSALDSLHLTGVGYEFGGHFSRAHGVPIATGTFTSPGSDGSFAVVLVNAFGPHAYCGLLFLPGDVVAGRFAYVTSGVAVLGVAYFSADVCVPLEGEFDQSAPKPRFTLAGASATRNVELSGSIDEDADLAAGSWTSMGSSGGATGTWSAALCP